MTVTTNTNKVQALGNGATTNFPYSFRIYAATDLIVTVTDLATGVDSVKVLNTDYTVTGAGSYNGGNVVFSVAPASNTRVTIQRVISINQGTDLRNQGAYYAETHEDAFDRMTMIAQQQQEVLERSLTLAPTSSGVSTSLPNASASTVIGWNDTGTALKNYGPVDNTLLAVDLADSVTLTKGVALVGGAGRVVNSIATLRTLPKTGSKNACVTGYYAAGDGGGGFYYYDAADATTADNGGTVIVATDGGRWKLQVSSYVTVKQFGAKGDDSTNDTTAFSNALTYVKVSKKALVIPQTDAAYLLNAATLNFAWEDGTVEGDGFPTLHFTGTGNGFILDSGGSGAYIKHMTVRNLHIKGGPAITNGFYSRGMVVGGIFENIEVRECNNIGFELIFSVMNTYRNLRVSNDNAAMTTTPVFYYRLTDDGTAGNKCQSNTFINCDASGKGATSVSTGWALDNSVLNNWIGGNSQSLQVGINIRSDLCRMNSWRTFDLEDNVDHDIIVKGYNNVFDGITSQSGTAVLPNIDITTGKGTVFQGGGYLRWVNLGASSSDTVFNGVGIDQNSGGSIGIKGTGTHRKIGCTKIDGAGAVVGTLPDHRVVNETASRALATTYTNNTGSTLFATVIVTLTTGSVAEYLIDGVAVAYVSSDGTATKDNTGYLMVPAGSTYRVNSLAGSVTLSKWTEVKP